MRHMIIAMTTLGLTGCLSERNFDERFARAVCKKAKECDRSAFDKEWECVDQAEAGTALMHGFQGDCDFNRDKAKQCLKDVRSATCSEYESGIMNSACEEVYDNCSGGMLDSGSWFDSGPWDTGL